MEEYGHYVGDGFNSIQINKNNEKIVYKYSSEDNEKIANSLLKIITQDAEKGRNIFSSCFSPGLIEILLMKGYVFERDVFEDSELLTNQLTNAGFKDFAAEVNKIKKETQSYMDSANVYIAVASETVLNVIKSNEDLTLAELRSRAEEFGSEELNDLVKNIVEELAHEEAK
jgi:hypothetical protein